MAKELQYYLEKGFERKVWYVYGEKYCCLNDVATWMSLLAKGKAVYITEGLSYFRLHPNQNSRTLDIVFTALREWLDLIIDSKRWF